LAIVACLFEMDFSKYNEKVKKAITRVFWKYVPLILGMMLGALSIIVGAPNILSQWVKMPFTQVDPYDSYGST